MALVPKPNQKNQLIESIQSQNKTKCTYQNDSVVLCRFGLDSIFKNPQIQGPFFKLMISNEEMS